MLFAQNISDYQWTNRLILLVDETLDSSALRSQRKLFLMDKDGLAERDIVLFELTPESIVLSSGKKTKLTALETYRALSIPKDFKGVLLVGKDGGVKLRKPFELASETIFNLIDGMPMRRSEMKRNQGN